MSGSAFVHVIDAADVCAFSAVILGLRDLENNFLLESILRFNIQRDSEAYWRHNLFFPWRRGYSSLTTASADFCNCILRFSTSGSTVAHLQISHGNSHELSAYACRIYVVVLRPSIGFNVFATSTRYAA